MTTSLLEGVPGLGPSRQERLLARFGTVQSVREASLEELLAEPWLPRPVAETLFDHLHPRVGAGGAASPVREADSSHG